MTKTPGAVRIAAVGDLHFGRADGPPLRALFGAVVEQADVLALCGDLTDTGEPEEARALARVLATASVPTVAALGNHDSQGNKMEAVTRILADAVVHVRDGNSYEVFGVGFAGAKGFAGGFGRGAL